MMQFLLPGFLVGLIGLAIPLAIHLWNTRDSRVIKVGSIRWLQESDSVKVSRIKINEVPLLILRLLIIMLLVFMLADLRSKKLLEKRSSAKWVLVDHGIVGLPVIADRIARYEELGWEPRWLHASFASLDEIIELDVNQNHWEILSRLDNSVSQPDSIIIFSSSQSRNFDGIRPELSIPILWMTIPNIIANGEPVLGLDRGDSVIAYFGNYRGSNLIPERAIEGFRLSEVNGIKYYNASSEPDKKGPVIYVDSVFVKVIGDDASEEVRNVKSALNAINSKSFEHISINSPTEANFIIDFSGEIIPNPKQVMITLKLDDKANCMLVRELGSFNEYYFSKPLSIDNIMRFDLLEDLYEILITDFYSQLRSRSSLELPNPAGSTNHTDEIQPQLQNKMADLSSTIWLILVILIGVERAISNFRKQ